MIRRGEVWWASLPEPVGSEPGSRRPVLVVQADPFTASRIRTVLVAVISSNTGLSQAPGNVFLEVSQSGLPRDSVVNVSQVVTADKRFLTERVGRLPPALLNQVDRGLRLVLAL